MHWNRGTYVNLTTLVPVEYIRKILAAVFLVAVNSHSFNKKTKFITMYNKQNKHTSEHFSASSIFQLKNHAIHITNLL